MDLLHSGRFDGFCLVSSDSDFTRLAARIREQGDRRLRHRPAEDPGELPAGLHPLHLHREFRRRARRRAAVAKTALRPMAEAVELIDKALRAARGRRRGLVPARHRRAAADQSLAGVRHPHLRPRQAQRPRRGDRPLRDQPLRPARPAAAEARAQETGDISGLTASVRSGALLECVWKAYGGLAGFHPKVNGGTGRPGGRTPGTPSAVGEYRGATGRAARRQSV